MSEPGSGALLAAARAPLRYPRSFLGLLIAGFLLVALPLAGGLAWTAWNMDRLAERSTNAVFNAAQAARVSRSLVNRIGSIERMAKQMLVERGAELMADYLRVHRSFKAVAAELSELPLDVEQLGVLYRTVAQEQELFELLAASPRVALDPADIGARTAQLAESAYEVLAISYLAADHEAERLRATAQAAQLQLIVLPGASLALALVIAFTLTRVIARPIAELDASIRQLGSANLSRPIDVHGPQDLRDLGVRLEWLRSRLTELEEQRNRFLRHLSHDLKTPLTALREGTELLGDEVPGPLAPAQRQVVGIMRDNSVRLQRMIDELLDYQRALHAASALELERVRIDALLERVAVVHRLAAQAKGQRFELEAAPLDADADPEKLGSILDNLIGNAVKFTPPGGSVKVSARREAGDVVIDVIDSGPGVPEPEREAIFDSFFRGRATAGGRIEGSGLGLAIAREYVQAHGGRIAVLPGDPGGHFRVTIPGRSSAPLARPA
ncbi:MAG: ATP-binding protein [Burkholderiales bacterium]